MDSKITELYLRKVLLLEKHDESDMSNPEERKEVEIGKKILKLIKQCETTDASYADTLRKIKAEANALVKMHQVNENVNGPDVHTVKVLQHYIGGPTPGEEMELYDRENATILTRLTDVGIHVTIRTPDSIHNLDVPYNALKDGVVTVDQTFKWDEHHKAYNGLNK